MQKLITQLEKEIAAASKAFNKAADTMSRLREKSNSEMTEKDYTDFSNASAAYQKYDAILTALYPMQKKLQSLIEDNA